MKYFFYACFICSIIGSLSSCKHEHHEDEHHHEHAIQLTAYTDSMELFAEISPLEVGEEATFLLHCTWLSSFKPLQEGSAEVKVIYTNEKNNSAKVDKVISTDEMEEIGIFEMHYTPKNTGNVTLEVTIHSKNGDNTFTFSDLKAFDDEEEAHEDLENREITATNGVNFTKEMSWNMDFSTEQVKLESLGQTIHATAQIIPAINDETGICATVNGVVNLTTNQLTEGQAVSTGQTLFIIDGTKTINDNLAVESSKALADYQLAKKQYDRAQSLIADKLITQSELDEAKSNYQTAEAIYRNAKKNFSTGTQVLKATMTGYITQLLVTEGDFVTEGQTLAVIGQNQTMQIKAEVSTAYYNQLKDLSDATFKCSDAADATYHSIKEYNGKMLSYGKQTATGNPLIPVIFEIKNKGNMVPGSFVDMYITTQGGESLPTIPSQAILEEMGNYFVFVQLTPELFEKRQVKLGNTNGIRTAIKSGLSATDRVVVKGAVLVKLQQGTGGVDPHSGHTH